MDVRDFIKQMDERDGQSWSDDTNEIVKIMEAYALHKLRELKRRIKEQKLD